MVQPRTQLSLIPSPRVLLRYHPEMQPPEATGPCELGTFAASLAGRPDLRGYGEDEAVAVLALAVVLLHLAAEEERRAPLTSLGQALTAARRLSEDAFLVYLRERTETPVLDWSLPAWI